MYPIFGGGHVLFLLFQEILIQKEEFFFFTGGNYQNVNSTTEDTLIFLLAVVSLSLERVPGYTIGLQLIIIQWKGINVHLSNIPNLDKLNTF